MSALALTELVLQLVLAGIQVAPQIIAAAQTEVALLKSSSAPTAAEDATIQAALKAAHILLQS